MNLTDLIFDVAELKRRLSQLIQYGTIAEVDGIRARVQIGELRTALLPWLTHRASEDITWWQPRMNEQVLVLAPSGDLAQGIVLPAIYQDAYMPAEQDPDVHTVVIGNCKVTVDREGKIILVTPNEALLDSRQIDVDCTEIRTKAAASAELETITAKLSATAETQLSTPVLAIGCAALQISAQQISLASPMLTAEISGSGVTLSSPQPIQVQGDVVADGISLKTHTHAGVEPGPGSTGGPQ